MFARTHIALAAAVAAFGFAVAAAPASAVDPPAGCTTSAGVATCVFAVTGDVQTWTVPAGVTSATFDLYGAEGSVSQYGFQSGGKGAHLRASLAVTGGQILRVLVGGRGVVGSGGFNGGGVIPGCCGARTVAGPGDGASDVRSAGGALTDRLLVAGGGGGGGGCDSSNVSPIECDHPGGAGGASAASGDAGVDVAASTAGGVGKAGSDNAGGTGGSGGTGSRVNGTKGDDGTLGQGGTGGSGGLSASGDGGGGGGRYYGGGAAVAPAAMAGSLPWGRAVVVAAAVPTS